MTKFQHLHTLIYLMIKHYNDNIYVRVLLLYILYNVHIWKLFVFVYSIYIYIYSICLLYCKRDIRLLRSIYSFEYYTIYTIEFCNTDDMSVNKCLPFISGSPADSCDCS